MEEKINELLNQVFNIVGEDSDVTIIIHKDDKCGTLLHGSADNNARSVFSCMHQSNNKIGEALYRIVKLNALNILTNPSPFSEDLLDSVKKAIGVRMDEMESDKKIQAEA